MVIQARTSGVNLRNEAEREKWKTLAKLDYRKARFPCQRTLDRLGIQQCFNEMLAECQLTTLFTPTPSYQVLTLEFLSTLEVQMRNREVLGIKFRLRNFVYELTMEQLREMYGCTAEDPREPVQFKPRAFWQTITNSTNDFVANRAKSSSIRNPVLRMLQRALACHPFNRVEHGSLQREEVFFLWSMAHKRPFNWVFAIIKNLERTSKKDRGSIGCGSIVGFIAQRLEVATTNLVADIGDSLIDFGVLCRSSMIGVDERGRAYLLQKNGDHYPLPDIHNTYINGPTHPANWGMSTPVHRAMVAQYPPRGSFRGQAPIFEGYDAQAQPEIREYQEEAEADQFTEALEDDGGEAAVQPTYGDPGASSSRTRRRGDRVEEDIESLRARMESWETRQEEQWTQINTRMERMELRQEEHYATQDVRWNTYLQFMQEMRGHFAHHPPPPSQ